VRYWLPVVVWTAIIFLLSSDLMAASHTGGFLRGLIAKLLGRPLSDRHFEMLHFVIRKFGHLTEYAFLSALLFRAIRGARPGWRLQWAVRAIAISTFIASLDESWQTLFPTRSGSPWDVAIDAVGAAAAQGIIRAAQVLFF
jgi:VanZ family protein